MQVDFYHLAASPLEKVLPRICERVLAGGGRLLVVTGGEELSRRLDEQLWTYAADSFLPHGRTGEGAADQPVLIADAIDLANGARNVALADGVWRDEALGFERAFHFFGQANVEAARAAWRGLKGRTGVEPRYWRQDEAGRWQQAS